MPLFNSGNWNPALHPRDSNGEFIYTDGGLHGRAKSATISDKMVSIAWSHLGSLDWEYGRYRSWTFPKNSNKCNLFVAEVANAAGAIVPMNFHTTWRFAYPPLAREWADPKVAIPGWKVVSTPQPGDIVAEQIDYDDGAASGHVGIVLGPGQTISTDDLNGLTGKITSNHFGFGPNQLGTPVFRRYTEQ